MTRPITVALALFISLVACSGPTEPTAVASVSLNPNTITLASGSSTTLAAATLDAKGNALTGRIITWSSSDAGVATVSATGVVTAGQNRGGSPALVTISASSEGKTGTATVSVTPVPIAKVIFAVDSIVIDPGVSTQLSIAVQDTAGIALTGRTITWTSLDTTIAKVNASGQVTAGAYTGPDRRDTRVVANAENRADTVRIIVSPLVVARVILSVDSVIIESGSGKMVTATAQDAAGTILTGRSVAWSIVDTTIARVSSSGEISTKRYLSGERRRTSVVAVIANKADTAIVAVQPIPVSKVAIVSPANTIPVGGTFRLRTIVSNSLGDTLTGRTVLWTSSDSSIARIMGEGSVSGLRTGSTTVRATSEGVSDSLVLSTVVYFGSQSIVAGQSFTCAIAIDGAGHCWGVNNVGQLGNGEVSNEPPIGPVAVSGGHTFFSLSSKGSHTCGIIAGGEVVCWGANQDGGLGDGSRTASSVPVRIATDQRFVSIAVGATLSCGITNALETYCWGSLSAGNPPYNLVPTKVADAPPLTQLSLTYWNGICGLTPDNLVYCWGDGASSVFTSGNNRSPKQLNGSVQLTSLVSGRYHTCGLTSAGRAYCWGRGNLGHSNSCSASDIGFSLSNCAVNTEALFTRLAAGSDKTCGITRSQELYCFTSSGVAPVTEASALRFEALDVGPNHTCGIATDRVAYCWGSYGFLGTEDPPLRRTVPVPIKSDVSYTSLGTTGGSTCGSIVSGAIICWGNIRQDSGQVLFREPVQISQSPALDSLRGGRGHYCGLTVERLAFCWGENFWGQTGIAQSSNPTPSPSQPVSTTIVFSSISTGAYHSCGVSTDSVGYCWGMGSFGTIGDSLKETTSSPRRVYGDYKFLSLTAGETFTCGLTVNREVYCWGTIFSGLSSPLPFPVRLSGNSNFRAISAARYFACGIDDNDRVFCWGARFGVTPVRMTADFPFLSLGAASESSDLCGISRNEETWCWNDSSSSIPTMVLSPVVFKSVSSSVSHKCGIEKFSSRAHCWGSVGLLGDGEVPFRLDPRPIIGGIRFWIP